MMAWVMNRAYIKEWEEWGKMATLNIFGYNSELPGNINCNG